jgi:hypothetical protein
MLESLNRKAISGRAENKLCESRVENHRKKIFAEMSDKVRSAFVGHFMNAI